MPTLCGTAQDQALEAVPLACVRSLRMELAAMTWRHPSERHSWFKTTFRAGTRARADTEREGQVSGTGVNTQAALTSRPDKAGPAAIPGRAPRGASGTSETAETELGQASERGAPPESVPDRAGILGPSSASAVNQRIAEMAAEGGWTFRIKNEATGRFVTGSPDEFMAIGLPFMHPDNGHEYEIRWWRTPA